MHELFSFIWSFEILPFLILDAYFLLLRNPQRNRQVYFRCSAEYLPSHVIDWLYFHKVLAVDEVCVRCGLEEVVPVVLPDLLLVLRRLLCQELSHKFLEIELK